MYLTEIHITSDNSIWPFEENSEDSVFYIPFGPILYPIAVDQTTCYATFYVMKDYSNEFYNRQVQKIFVVFSFMGGLIGAIMASLFIINTYTSFAFQLALALQVFTVNKNGSSQKKSFHNENFSLNILHFFKYLAYSVGKKIKSDLKSPFYQHVAQCRDQILEQLDIRNLIKRIIFLQYSLSFILEDYQLAEMHAEKPTLPHQVKKLRKRILSEVQTNQDLLEQQISNKQLYPQLGKIEKSQANSIVQKKKPHHKIQKSSVLLNTPKQSPTLEDEVKGANQTNSVSNVIVYDENGNHLRKKHENLKRLKESAKEGNIVSRKLLQVICYQKENCPSEISSRNKDEF